MDNFAGMVEVSNNKIDYSLNFYGHPEILYTSNVDSDYVRSLEEIVTESGHSFVRVDNVTKSMHVQFLLFCLHLFF